MDKAKSFFHLTVSAPGSVHDARSPRRSSLFQQIFRGENISNKVISLGDDTGVIPLLTIGDGSFPQLECSMKGSWTKEQTRDPKKCLFSKKLCSAMVVAENPYGMLKGRWQIILKKCEARMYNMKYIVSATVVLHSMYLFQWPVWTKIEINGRGINLIQNNDILRLESL